VGTLQGDRRAGNRPPRRAVPRAWRHPEVEEADWNQPEKLQINMVAFPSIEQAHAWYNSPEYGKALAFRQGAVHRRLFFVHGTDEP
jgi:uncharacterized protein (DUF1330 family)